MRQATSTTSRITPTRGKSLAKTPAAALSSRLRRISHCYISPRSRQFNRQPVRLEIAISPTKQTTATQFNRQLFNTPQNRFSRSPSHHGTKRVSAVSSQPRHLASRNAHVRATNHQSLLASHHSQPFHESQVTPNHVELTASAKKQQIRPSLSNSVGLYFLATYAQFSIGRRRALMHNGGTAVAAVNNARIHAVLLGSEPSRERQSTRR